MLRETIKSAAIVTAICWSAYLLWQYAEGFRMDIIINWDKRVEQYRDSIKAQLKCIVDLRNKKE